MAPSPLPLTLSRLWISLIGMIALLLVIPTGLAQAGQAEVVRAVAIAESDGSFRFDVTIRHADTGWEHYADAWEVRLPEDFDGRMPAGGMVLGTRVLLHPHVNEQPFTRSLRRVKVPEGVTRVMIRARDSVHGWNDQLTPVQLPGR